MKIEIRDVYKSFGSKEVLKGVNLVINEGETLVVIGSSGGGKSVLLKLITGLIEPDRGEILFDGKRLSDMSMDEAEQHQMKFGMLFQSAALFDSLNVMENVGFVLQEHRGMKESELRPIVREKLRMVGLEGIENQMPASLSGGMKKRVGLARAICYDPQVIVYDEPTTGLDPINSDVINDLIISMQEKLKVTSVAVTHDMVSAYKVADRIAMLYRGQIVGIGTPDEIQKTQNPVIRQFVTGSAHGPITDEPKKVNQNKNEK
ncbi:MAG TPA: ABC transporter ATP-binding protein [Candidatus Omnitrophota bacterium]|nr:ABC transporter ATP-binding protein [Candidatus Omnitrophota bacterium]